MSSARLQPDFMQLVGGGGVVGGGRESYSRIILPRGWPGGKLSCYTGRARSRLRRAGVMVPLVNTRGRWRMQTVVVV